MLATDGVFTRERLDMPKPRDTGTGDTSKPLGGWEHKETPDGVFLVRPGIFFPLDLTKNELANLKARGVQRAVLSENRQRVLDYWHKADFSQPLELKRGLFIGLKAGLSKSKEGIHRSPDACQWVTRPIALSLAPTPKRERIEGQRLVPWPWIPAESTPYNPALIGREGAQIKAEEALMQDQPDADYSRL